MVDTFQNLQKRYEYVKNRLSQAEKEYGRPQNSVHLLPVSKTFGLPVILEAIDCGMREFGENYVQEACEKIDWLKSNRPDLNLTWHLIGPLQSNKTRAVAERFDWVQTIDRLKIAERLSAQRPTGMKPLNVLIEVNISNQDSKSGITPPEVYEFAKKVAGLPNLKLRGLMCIPEPGQTEEEKLEPLVAMKELFDSMNALGFNFDTLSMGMSGDLEEAVRAGTTMVRVGTAIFGQRDYSQKQG